MSSPSDSICIVGRGARSPLGHTAEPSAAAVRCGISAIAEHPYMVDKAGEPVCAAMGAGIAGEIEGVDRFWALAEPAVAEALRPIAAAGRGMKVIAATVGLPHARPGVPPDLEAQISRRMGAAGFEAAQLSPIGVRMAGNAAGLMALEEGCRRIRSGELDLCLAGGVDTWLDPDAIEWLDESERLMSAGNPFGFPPGEGAAFLLLASHRAVAVNGLKPLAWIRSAATATEKKLIHTEAVCTGEGLSEAFAGAVAPLKLPDERISLVIDDINGDRYRTDELMYSILRISRAFADPIEYLHPCDCWGDVGAASGPLGVVLAAQAGLRGYARGSHTLVWASSDTGERAAMVIRVGVPAEN